MAIHLCPHLLQHKKSNILLLSMTVVSDNAEVHLGQGDEVREKAIADPPSVLGSV
jgi:hypothetical protein